MISFWLVGDKNESQCGKAEMGNLIQLMHDSKKARKYKLQQMQELAEVFLKAVDCQE